MDEYLKSNELKINCIDQPVYYGKTSLIGHSNTIKHCFQNIDSSINEIEFECQSYDLYLFLLYIDNEKIPKTLEDKIKLVKIADYLDMKKGVHLDNLLDSLFESFDDDRISWGSFNLFAEIDGGSIYDIGYARDILERIDEVRKMQEMIDKFRKNQEIPKKIEDKKILLKTFKYSDEQLTDSILVKFYESFKEEGLLLDDFDIFAEKNSLYIDCLNDMLQILERIDEVREMKRSKKNEK